MSEDIDFPTSLSNRSTEIMLKQFALATMFIMATLILLPSASFAGAGVSTQIQLQLQQQLQPEQQFQQQFQQPQQLQQLQQPKQQQQQQDQPPPQIQLQLRTDEVQDINAQDSNGNTILHAVVLANSPSYQSIIALLEFGIDRTIRNNDGLTAEDIAQYIGRTDLARLIRTYGKR